jgi:3'(2'), 5'-bisphosphate nucleotidase
MYEKELAAMIKAALDAEVGIRAVYDTAFAVEIKSDNSPVTAADKNADAAIRKELHAAFPKYAFLTEESADDKSRLTNDYVFIVDPVDGTKEFVSRNGEFCTNIGLSYKHEIVAGVINVPMKNVLYYAVKGQGAYRLEKGKEPVRIHVNSKVDNLTVLRSISFFVEKEEALIRKHKDRITHIVAIGAALKFCAIAQGDAEISYRMTPNTKEWDIAAGTIIIKEAGGLIQKLDGTEYAFNRDDVYNRDGYILANRPENILL